MAELLIRAPRINPFVKRIVTPAVQLYFGPPGVYKSTYVRSLYPDAFADKMEKNGGSDWWDGYEGQDVVIWDEYRCSDLSWTSLLRLTDACPVAPRAVKYGRVPLIFTKIIFTCPDPLEEWYSGVTEHRDQLYRRFTDIFEVQPGNIILCRKKDGVYLDGTPQVKGQNLAGLVVADFKPQMEIRMATENDGPVPRKAVTDPEMFYDHRKDGHDCSQYLPSACTYDKATHRTAYGVAV